MFCKGKENSETPHGYSRRFHTFPVHGFNNRVHFVSSAGWHVFLSVSHNGFCMDPHAFRKSCTHPILLFISYIPTSNSIHDGNGVWEFRLWDQVGQVDPILHMGCPVLFRNIFSRSPCHGTNLGLLQPSSSCLFIEQYVLFLPFIFMDRRYPVHSWPPINGAGSKYKKKSVHDLKTETRMTLRFARARTTTRGTKHPQQWRHIAFVQSLVVVISLFFFQL